MKKIFLIFLLTFILIGCGQGTLKVSSGSNPTSVTLLWTASTTNTDGTPLTNLSGYKVYYGTTSSFYTVSIDVIGNVTTYDVTNLALGTTYYFAVTAYDSTGKESDFSNEVWKSL